MRYHVRYHYKNKVTGQTVFSNLESVHKFVANYLADSVVENNPSSYSIEDTKDNSIVEVPLFWR